MGKKFVWMLLLLMPTGLLLGCNGSPGSEYKLADSYRSLRETAFTAAPSSMGVSPASRGPVWGAIMETGYPEGVVTLVALADGSVSIYFSSGGGFIGGGGHEGPRTACMEFLAASGAFMGKAKLTKEHPLPHRGRTRFYFRTRDGVYGTPEFEENDLGKGKSPLSPLFYKAHEAIAQVRMVEERREGEQRTKQEGDN